MLSEDELRDFEGAGRALEAGDWAQARRLLKRLPPHDGPANFLRMALCELGDAPPDDWDGVLPVCGRGAGSANADEAASRRVQGA
jgi:hypothetical protein